MTTVALGHAVMAMMPTIPGAPIFEVRSTAKVPPWVVITQRLPRVSGRSEGGSTQGHRCQVRALLVHTTPTGIRYLADHVQGALEGVRPVAAGWSASPLRQFNEREPEDGKFTIAEVNLSVLVAVLEFEFTATST